MLAELKDVFDKMNRDRYAIGYDLNREYAQISYCKIDSDSPETLSTVEGEDTYNIPLVLSKRRSDGQWCIGADAMAAVEEGDGELVTNLLSLALDKELVTVQRAQYQATDLLALFIKRSLALLPMMGTPEKIADIVIAVRNADEHIIPVLQETVGVLKHNSDKISFISYEESVFFYMLYQPGELQNHQILVCDASEEYLWSYRMERNLFVNPALATVEAIEYKNFPVKDSYTPDAKRDERFLQIVQELCDNRVYSGIFLIGEGFYEEWSKESLRFLCKNRRVFKGNNLFSKGAALAAREKANPSGFEKNIVFLGTDKLKANIGIRIFKDGHETVLPLMEAGVHWYEAKGCIEVILSESNVLPISVEYVTKNGTAVADFPLVGMPCEPGRITRVRIQAHMQSEDVIAFKVTDLGFGEIYPSSGFEWEETMNIQG
ncbi:MAG: hypothetical protein E7288_07520 [Lachnospiraceae bacterium]|nr:hypothetical protein [Lachnospiraceae bacterium]